MVFPKLSHIRLMFHNTFRKEGISSLGQQGEFCEILRAVPISFGSSSLKNIVKQRTIEDCCSRRVFTFQSFCRFGQAVPKASIPMSVMLKDEATMAWRDVARVLGAPEREIREMATAFEHEEADLARA